jgi:hypothetical protein
MIISPSPEEFRAAQALQLKCDLKRVFLKQCHLSLEGPEESLKGPYSVHFSHNSVASDIKEGMLRIEVRFKIQGHDSAEPPASVFSIDCAFDADYFIEDKLFQPSPESIAAFKDGNAVFNCWPYVREFVQNTTARMCLMPPPLPFLRVVPRRAPEVQAPPEIAPPPPKSHSRRVRKPAATHDQK